MEISILPPPPTFSPGKRACLRTLRRALFLAFGALIACAFPARLSGQIHFNRLDHTDGLPQINAMSIYQDEFGAMWFGTTNGLCRYNGLSTRVFRPSPHTDGLTRSEIMSITGNGDGAVYLRAESDLIRYDIAGERFSPLSTGITAMSYGGGKLWFAVGHELRAWSESDETVTPYLDITGIEGRVMALCVSAEGDVLVGGYGGLVSVKTGEGAAEGTMLLDDVSVTSLFIDGEGLTWVGTDGGGIHVLDGDGVLKWRFSHTEGENSISNNVVRSIAEDGNGVIWAGTFFGLNSFDKSAGEWTNHIHDDTQPGSLSHSSVFAIYRDAQNTVWVGTYFGGVNYFNPGLDIFRYYNASSVVKDRLSFPFVGNMTEDSSGNLWICTEGGGLNRLDMRTRRFTRYLDQARINAGRRVGYNLKSIWYDPSTDKLYIGIHNAGLCVFDPKTENSTFIDRSGLSVRGMQPWRGSIVLLTNRGLYRLDTDTDTIAPFSDDAELTAQVNREYMFTFFIDSRDRLWMSISDAGLKCIDLNTGAEKRYLHDSADPRSFGRFDAMSIAETRSGDLYFGTLGSGLFRYSPATDDFDNFTEADKTVIDDFCYHITETEGGNLILLHGGAFSIFDPRTGVTVYNSIGNFPLTGFFEGSSSYITRDGEIFIGGVNGLVSVGQERLMELSPIDYNLWFDGLTVNGDRIVPGDGTKILSKTLPLTDKVRLRHNRNSFLVEFATSDYSRHGAISNYEYKLEGSDDDWTTASSNVISYTRVEPGRYRLLVREVDHGKSGDGGKMSSLAITVSPPFYGTVFAYILYALMTGALFVGLVFFLMWRYRLRAAVEMERKEKENNERLHQAKLGFFTSVSHEFRTPLTLIMAQVEHIFSARDLTPDLKLDLSKVHENASHMRDLISELLDFRKAEQGYRTLDREEVDLVRYIDGIYRSFTEYADKHGIGYVYDFPSGEVVTACIDRVQFKKAIYNLLSNAFKYTHDGGEIAVRLRADDDNIRIEVEDNGIGISSEMLSRIFERFYQVEYRTSGFSLGTGIGLALAKEIIESHGGGISVRSTLNEGSVFEITLQRGIPSSGAGTVEADTEEAGSPTPPQRPAEWVSTLYEITEIPDPVRDDVADEPRSILIVEDNERLLSLLSEIFSADYDVHTALNGRQGLEIAEKHLPDVILTDVMMPEMSGREMCRRIKNDVKLSHIPVVMLTSLDSADETMEGYMFGADDYVAKPFNVDLLKARCDAIVRGRRLLFRSVARSRELAGVEVRSEHDAAFLKRASDIIRANFDNPEFDMDMLASEMGVGRNKLYVSMKKISGMTPNEFTLAAKLRESTELLRDHLHLNVSEIADRLGFSSLKYFSKSFKTFYGVTPVQWRNENKTT